MFKQTALYVVIGASLALSGCASSPFGKAEPVPEPRYVPNIVLGEPQTLTILPSKTPCNSELPMLCLLATNEEGQTFQIPYNWVDGFSHANGVQYRILVRPQIDDNTSNMTGKWVLDSVLSQQ